MSFWNRVALYVWGVGFTIGLGLVGWVLWGLLGVGVAVIIASLFMLTASVGMES